MSTAIQKRKLTRRARTPRSTDFDVDPTARIVGSRIGAGSAIYRFAAVDSSVLGESCVVGDLSRVTGSKLGQHVKTDRFTLVYHATIGDFSYTGPSDMIFHTEIGRFCAISWGVTIGPADHDYRRITSHNFLYNRSYGLMPPEAPVSHHCIDRPSKIGNDVWIGASATILRGVTIGDGAVVGANSVVTRDVPPYAIVAGAPARIIKFRFEKKTIAQLLKLQWWNLPKAEIKRQHAIFARCGVEEAVRILAKNQSRE